LTNLRLLRVWLLVFIAVLVLHESDSRAQWSIAAPAVLGAQSPQAGAITYRNGLLWAGTTALWLSADIGTTWTKRSPTLFNGDGIRDVNFYDANTGLVGTENGIIYETRDQGRTWVDIHHAQSCSGVCFVGSTSYIMVATGGGGSIDCSSDGGNTWYVSKLDNFVTGVIPIIGGSAVALSGSSGGASIFITTDYGATWVRKNGKIDFDTYSFAIDPCSTDRVYAVNEEGSTISNGLSEIYITNDGGQSWQSKASQKRIYYSGSISIASNAIYCQTINSGIVRSTDFGANWSTINGPSAPYDTRLVCAVDDNLIIAADQNGNIWRTNNSGGDTVRGSVRFTRLSVLPADLFSGDTLLPCDPPVTRGVRIEAVFCNSPSVLSQKILGADSLDYKLVHAAPKTLTGVDSVIIEFNPLDSGARHGLFEMMLEDSTIIDIPLGGFGRGASRILLSAIGGSTDTIGGTVYVPILLKGATSVPSVEFVVHYDTAPVVYIGSFSRTGIRLDIANEFWPGRSKLHADRSANSTDTIIGYSIFAGYPITGPCTSVGFDSLSIQDSLAPCAFIPGGIANVQICFPFGCGVATISEFMRYHKAPTLSAFPNPTPGFVTLSSNISLEGSIIQVVDCLGTIRFSSMAIQKDSSTQLDLSRLPQGRYFVRVISSEGPRSISIVRN
jgi:photosystem II stability/assembly factor-like uncharacterized protein